MHTRSVDLLIAGNWNIVLDMQVGWAGEVALRPLGRDQRELSCALVKLGILYSYMACHASMDGVLISNLYGFLRRNHSGHWFTVLLENASL